MDIKDTIQLLLMSSSDNEKACFLQEKISSEIGVLSMKSNGSAKINIPFLFEFISSSILTEQHHSNSHNLWSSRSSTVVIASLNNIN
jgi:hypothetical protein